MDHREGQGSFILVVEDDPDIRELLPEMLAGVGAVEVACDGIEALERLRSGPRPSLVLLDLFLPRLSGPELLAWIRASAELANVPVVTMTASSCDAPPGSWAHLHKPFSVDALLAAIARAKDVAARRGRTAIGVRSAGTLLRAAPGRAELAATEPPARTQAPAWSAEGRRASGS